MFDSKKQNWSAIISFFLEETNSTSALFPVSVMVILISLLMTSTSFPSSIKRAVYLNSFSAKRLARVIPPT